MIRIETDPFPSHAALDELFSAAWGAPVGAGFATNVLPRSLVHLGALDDDRLVGFVNVAWDGGSHAFLLDTTVHPQFQRQGIATRLVQRATELARDRGAAWLHVDCEARLDGLYRGCGFVPTTAGLIRLK